MQNRVVRLKRRSVTFAEAVAAYRGARYDECLAAVDGESAPQTQILRARALTRLGRMEASLEECRMILHDELTVVERGELQLVKAVALLRLGRLEEAEAELLVARLAAYSGCSPALEADYETTEGLLSYSQRDIDAAASALDRALVVVPSPEQWMRPKREYFFSLGLVRARACDFRGLLVRAKEGLPVQLHWARMALHELDADPLEDQWVSAALLSNFALLLVEVGDPSVLDELTQRVTEAAWSPGIRLYQFNAVRSLGWLRALAGDHLGAFRDFRVSAELAPSRAWKLHAILDRAFLARELGQAMFAEDELNYAVQLAGELDLQTTADAVPPFTGLLKLAPLAALRDPAEGRAILERYQAARSKCPPIFFEGLDRSWQALELVAEATIARAEGGEQTAVDLFVNALDAFDKLGNRWRAALVSLELAEMTGQPFFYGYAAREAGRRPHSWLARRLASLQVH